MLRVPEFELGSRLWPLKKLTSDMSHSSLFSAATGSAFQRVGAAGGHAGSQSDESNVAPSLAVAWKRILPNRRTKALDLKFAAEPDRALGATVKL
jgi:hypothetical protein